MQYCGSELCSLPNVWGRNLGRPTTEDGGQHLSAIFVSAAKYYGENLFSSLTLHPPIRHTFALFCLLPPLQLLSSPHLSHLPSKQSQVIQDAAPQFFFQCSPLLFTTFSLEFLFLLNHLSLFFDLNTCYCFLFNIFYHLRLIAFCAWWMYNFVCQNQLRWNFYVLNCLPHPCPAVLQIFFFTQK